MASTEGLARADVAVRGGLIVAVGDVPDAAPTEIDAHGLIVMPGVIDTQVHFREPGAEHKEDLESGSRAAVFGGVTSVLEMPNTKPPTTTEAALSDKLASAEGRMWCHYGFFVGASADNAAELAYLERLPGTPGVKLFMGSSTGELLVSGSEEVRAVLRAGRKPVAVHSEDEARLHQRMHDWQAGTLELGEVHPRLHPLLRDDECARRSTQRLIGLAVETGRPVHVLHISTHDELPMLAEAKRRRNPVTCEITPQHLTFDSEDYERLGTLAQMNPPVRSGKHRDALRQALQDGLFDVVGSDHAPHTLEEKAQPYPESPSGMPGVQTLLPVMLGFVEQGLIGLTELVRLACLGPARLYGIVGKGRIAPGFDADVALVDPQRRWTFERAMVQSKCGWSPFEGAELTGAVVHTVVGGRWVVREGALHGEPAGRMLTFAGTA